MILRILLVVSLLLPSCGYHLVGQGKATVIPEGVSSASLQASSEPEAKQLLPELIFLWKAKASLPRLEEQATEPHVTLRIEQAETVLTPTAFDASGLAIQYRLQVSALLNMYQQNKLIWQSGILTVYADVFGGTNPTVIEAERERLTEKLRQQWAKEALARLQSGF